MKAAARFVTFYTARAPCIMKSRVTQLRYEVGGRRSNYSLT